MQSELIDEIARATFFPIMVDKVTTHNEECFRYKDQIEEIEKYF